MNEAIPTDPIFTKSFNLNFAINFSYTYVCIY